MLLHICDRHPTGDLRVATARQFGIDSESLEIDLCEDCAIELEQTLTPWVEAARPAHPVNNNGGTRVRPPKKAASKKAAEVTPPQLPLSTKLTKQERQTIRAWANENGYTVQARGSIAGHIIAAYRAAVAPSS